MPVSQLSTLDLLLHSVSRLPPDSFASQQPASSPLASRSHHPHPASDHLSQTTPNENSSSSTFALLPTDPDQAKHIFMTLHFLFPHELLPSLDILDRGLVVKLICSPSNETDESVALPLTSSTPDDRSTHQAAAEVEPEAVWYVRSASSLHDSTTTTKGSNQQQQSVSGTTNVSRKVKPTNAFYEVRLDAWNCSCAGFAFDSFKLITSEEEEERHEMRDRTFMETEMYDARQAAIGDEDYEQQQQPETLETEKEAVGGQKSAQTTFGGKALLRRHPLPICKHILAVALAEAAPNLFGTSVEVRENVSRDEMAGWAAGWGDFG